MKKIIYIAAFLITGTVVLQQSSCSKKVEGRTDNIPALAPADQDLNAGTWKTMLLTRPDTFAVVAPAATYAGELNEIKGLQQNLTGEQKAIIKYWSAGAVLRWNEIMRDLVAKHNLPPYQNSDTSYPIPNALNPFAYPEFPFSNPPYAARAYAYISAAQYDALVAAWHYKSIYARKAPYLVDSSISALVPRTDLSSYPSEDAVLAGVTAEMMKLLFPTEIGYIEQKAAEAEQYRLWAGANVRSDLVAGELLGRQVAQAFSAKARLDNAGKAVGTPADWANLETQCIARGETPWYSLETPRRNPMLPFFGNVKSLLIDSVSMAGLLPPPPPSTSSDKMHQETDEVYGYIKNPTRENIELVHFWADGAGTYTPPGHWNAIAAEDFINQHYSEVRWARNMALLNVTLMDAAIICWKTKYFYFNPRPTQMNPDIKTITGIPNFPSYISGHSTFSGAAATMLAHIIPSKADYYMKLADDASKSRMVAGIHYRADIEVGMQVGKSTAAFAVQRAMIDGAE